MYLTYILSLQGEIKESRMIENSFILPRSCTRARTDMRLLFTERFTRSLKEKCWKKPVIRLYWQRKKER